MANNPRLNWDPLKEVDEVADRINRLFSRNIAGEAENRWGVPATDVYEEGDKLAIEIYLPNFTEDEVDARINQNRLEIRAEHRAEDQHRERNYLRRESQQMSYYRQFMLPDDIDANSADAEFRDGVLCITFNRQQTSEPKKLALHGGRSHQQRGGQGNQSGRQQQGGRQQGQSQGQQQRPEELRQTMRPEDAGSDFPGLHH